MRRDHFVRYRSALVAGLLVVLAGCSGSVQEAVEELDPLNPPAEAPSSAQGEPSASLSSTESQIDSGATTMLNWSSSNADGCVASGAWSGSKDPAGSELVGPLTAPSTYTLTCSNANGNAVAMITVEVNGIIQLSWVAPTENVDGSALTDLAGYKIYYGVQSRSYLDWVDVDDVSATSLNVALATGEYFVAMTAHDADGNESAYSNEVLKSAE